MLVSCHLEFLSCVGTDPDRLWNREILRCFCLNISKVLRDSLDVNVSWPLSKSAAKLTHATSEADKPGLGDRDLAVLVRTGTAAGLGVHIPHQGLYLLNVEALGYRKAGQVQALAEAKEKHYQEVSHV